MFPGELREFLAVVREGSIRKASQSLGVAPSSVSRKIAVFEHQFGTALFDRTMGGAVLTPAGALVADYARSVLADYENLRSDLDDRRGTKRRVIRLTVVESIVSGGLVRAATEFRQQFDTLSFRINVAPATQVPERLRQGDADIGVTFCSQPHPDFTAVARVPEPIVLAVAPDHPLAARSHVRIDELAKVQLAVPDPSFSVRVRFDRAWHETHHGMIEPSVALMSNSFESLREFAREGAGASVLPARAILGDVGHGLTPVHIDHPDCLDCTLDILVLRKNRVPKIVEQFLKVLVRTLEAQSCVPPRRSSRRAKPRASAR